MGFCDREPSPLRVPTTNSIRTPLPRECSRDVRFSQRHETRPSRSELLEQPDSGPLLRARMERHRPLTRRLLLASAPALIGLSRKTDRPITGSFVNDAFATGHRIRDRDRFRAPVRRQRIPIVIIGGGIAGLSAAWRLDKRGIHDFVLLETEPQAGGNSRWGENEVSKFPSPATSSRRPRPAGRSRWGGSARSISTSESRTAQP